MLLLLPLLFLIASAIVVYLTVCFVWLFASQDEMMFQGIADEIAILDSGGFLVPSTTQTNRSKIHFRSGRGDTLEDGCAPNGINTDMQDESSDGTEGFEFYSSDHDQWKEDGRRFWLYAHANEK